MANLNMTSVVIGGRLTADPDLRKTANGTSVCQITVAVNNRGKNAGTSFFDVVAWKGTAEMICNYFKKGSSISLVGELQQRKYTDRNGQTRSVVEVVADRVHFVDSRAEEAPKPEPKPQLPAEPNWDELGDDDDLPF